MSEVMVSGEIVPLPSAHLATITLAVAAIERLRRLPKFQDLVVQRRPLNHVSRFNPGYETIFDCYDFHLSEDGPKLIEINTNGSGSLLTALLQEYHGLLKKNAWGDCWSDFWAMIQSAWLSYLAVISTPERPLQRVAIVDSAPTQQRTYFEFKMFEEFFRSRGVEVVIADPSELSSGPQGVSWQGNVIDLIYNRLTDFYLETPEHAGLRAAYLSRSVCLTPHPFGYGLIADKSQLTDLSSSTLLKSCELPEHDIQAIQAVALKTLILNRESAPSLWEQRKKFFFKPQQAFGGKSAYRGATISRTPFERLISETSIAQEFAEPGRVGEFKFDLRVYTFQGRVLLVGTRLFQGQLLNFKTVGGGFGAVEVVPS